MLIIFLGSSNEPVRIVEFGDLGCLACRQLYNSGIKGQLLARFEGQINFTFRHFPVITRQSPKAAEVGQSAAEQERFWQVHDFVNGQTPPGALSISALEGYGAAISLTVNSLTNVAIRENIGAMFREINRPLLGRRPGKTDFLY